MRGLTNHNLSAESGRRQGPWGQDRRLEFIEFRLLWDGKINRGEVAEFFSISIQQASLDFAKYMELAPENMKYDRSEKVYRASDEFKPVLVAPDTQTYLNELAGLTSGTVSPSLSFVGTRPACDVVSLPIRRVSAEILLPILWAVRDRVELDVTYQSMRNPKQTRQWLAPHALAFDGARWHARAWCHGSSRFRDFVLNRIQEIHGRRATTVNSSSDNDWHEHAVIEIEPNPGLTLSQRDSVITDFGMHHGKLSKTIRKALVPYFVRHLRIDESTSSQPIVWANRSEFEEANPKLTVIVNAT
jgi:predicted DNA-binding transcriptional regulator YafY